MSGRGIDDETFFFLHVRVCVRVSRRAIKHDQLGLWAAVSSSERRLRSWRMEQVAVQWQAQLK